MDSETVYLLWFIELILIPSFIMAWKKGYKGFSWIMLIPFMFVFTLPYYVGATDKDILYLAAYKKNQRLKAKLALLEEKTKKAGLYEENS